MQQTCSRCGGVLAPGATVCNYCGTPTASTYPQQNFPPPPGTQYGTYAQTNATSDPYAAQYGAQPPPPPQVSGPSGPYGQPAYGGAPPAIGFGPPSQPSPFGPPPQPAGFGGFAPQQAPFAPPQPPPQQRSSTGKIIGILLAVIVVLAGLGVGGYLLFGKSGSTTVTSTPTPVASPTPSALYQANLTSDPGGWDCSNTTCSFRPDGYHVQAPDTGVYTTFLTKTFDNLVIEVKGIISQGDPAQAGLGIAFRVPQNAKLAGYGFLVYADGSYGLVKWDDKGNPTTLIDTSTSSTAIHQGVNQQNDIKLIVSGATFTFFVNGQQINSATDSTFANGYMGLAAISKGAEAVFSNLVITKP